MVSGRIRVQAARRMRICVIISAFRVRPVHVWYADFEESTLASLILSGSQNDYASRHKTLVSGAAFRIWAVELIFAFSTSPVQGHLLNHSEHGRASFGYG